MLLLTFLKHMPVFNVGIMTFFFYICYEEDWRWVTFPLSVVSTEVKGTPLFPPSTEIQECSFLARKDLAEIVQSVLEGLFYSHSSL